ncbi:DUF1642 domain-containing protein [Enterococcus faecalis]|uniref:DUF1642 domain-containing protein n=1 Tax=Enterococcus faecalis TaxID=1351 RepID=UPI00339AB9DA
MNKQELIENRMRELNFLVEGLGTDFPIIEDNKRKRIAYLENIIEDLKQLDEPEKVVVPKFVAEKIESYGSALEMLANEYFDQSSEEVDSDALACWIDGNADLFFKAWIHGYEVEKEQLYYVKMPLTEWNDDTSELETKYVYLTEDITSEEVRLQASNAEHGDWKVKLTEERVKSIDERYWLFAVKVGNE